MTTIPIVLMADKNYVIPTTIMMESLYSNKNPDTEYEIYILADNMDSETVSVFEQQSKQKFSVKVINMDNPYKNYVTNNPNISCTTFLKFEIPTLLSQYDKLLYLDVDIIVQKDLSELYNIDLKDTYAGVVLDYYLMKNGDNKTMGLKNYFNAGVMLFNSKKIREDFSKDIFGKTYLEKSDKLLHQDQDIFNYIFKDNILLLPPKYNWSVSNSYFRQKDVLKLFGITKEDTKLKNIAILHYTTRLKPWKYKHGTNNNIWQKYYVKTGRDLKSLNLKTAFFQILYIYLRNRLNLTRVDILLKKFINK